MDLVPRQNLLKILHLSIIFDTSSIGPFVFRVFLSSKEGLLREVAETVGVIPGTKDHWLRSDSEDPVLRDTVSRGLDKRKDELTGRGSSARTRYPRVSVVSL